MIFTLFITVSCSECWKTECANGGECLNDECSCEDGVNRPLCQLDTCMNELECENGHCEYGFCVCDEYWIGDKCDSLTYIDHSGDYFGGYECNNITVTTDIVSVSGTEDQDTFRFMEERTGYHYYVGFVNRNSFIITPQRAYGSDFEWIEVRGSGKIKIEEIQMEIRYTTYEFENIQDYSNCDFDGEKN